MVFYGVGDPEDGRFPRDAFTILVKNLQKQAKDSRIVAVNNGPTNKKLPYLIKIDDFMRFSVSISQWGKEPNSYYLRIQAEKQEGANSWKTKGDFCGYASGSFFNLGTGKEIQGGDFEYFYNEYMRKNNLT